MNKVKGYLVMAGYNQSTAAGWLGISRTEFNISIKRNAFTETEKKIIFRKIKGRIPKITYEELWS